MSEIADRYRKVAAEFTARAQQVPAEGWDAPTPCGGWVARDVMEHMVGTAGFFLGRAGIQVAPGPSVADDPVGAWEAARDAVQAALDDPATAQTEIEDFRGGTTTLEQSLSVFGVGDVLVHTWDLARATGQDDSLDPDECERLYAAMEPNDEMIRQGTAFGPKVDVPADADIQTRLVGFTGRTP